MEIASVKGYKIAVLASNESPYIKDYFERNKDYLANSMPDFNLEYLKESYWRKRLPKDYIDFVNGQSLCLFAFSANDNKVIATINFTQIQRGVFQGCFLGYSIDKDYQNKGLMTVFLQESINFVFESLNLHKVLANYMPTNLGSARVLEKLGFQIVGLAKQELFVNKKWEDFVETRLINDNWVNKF
ncbi:MAG: GNAT family N-acetyltransferase [Candidatus Cloacimonetes bacterium]|nr:GNAT family N-acetyltransferase [Candidatus Cloacimonadota bacterium]